MIQGIQIDLISEDRLARLTSMEKIHLILDSVRRGNIVIIEKGLGHDEECSLKVIALLKNLRDGD